MDTTTHTTGMEMLRRTEGGLHRGLLALGWVALAFIANANGVYAQLEQRQGLLQEGSVANYRFAEPGELSITVCLVGAVRLPGRYEISRSIDLMNLLALAGGWSEQADLSDVRISRVASPGDPNVRRSYTLDLRDYQEIQGTYLTLQQQDYIFVGMRTGITGQEILGYLTAAAALVTMYVTLTN
jgi:hypothetical protein